MRTKILGKLLPALIALGAGGLGFAQSWTSQDIGNPSVPGSTDDPNGAVRTIVGGGADICASSAFAAFAFASWPTRA